MLIRLYELSPRQWLVLGILTLIAGSMGWGIISPYFDDTREQRELCESVAAGIAESLKAANTCNSNEDCTQAPLPCPFSCNTYTNKNTPLDTVKETIHNYNTECGFCAEDCNQVKPVCVNHQCVSFATLPAEKTNDH
jgi:hypothetical protein